MPLFKKKTTYYLLLLLLQFHSAAGQNADFTGFEKRKQEALSNLEKHLNPDTSRINALLKVLNCAIFLKEKKEVIGHLPEAFILSRKLKYAEGLANCYLQQASFFKSSSAYKNALLYYDSALLISRELKETSATSIKERAFEQKGNIYYSQENYYAALDHYFEALKYITPDKLQRQIALYMFITQIYTLLNDLDKALEFAEKNMLLTEKDTSTIAKHSAYLPIIDVYLARNDLKKATLFLNKLEKELPYLNEVQVSFGYYLKRGKVSFMEQRFHQAYSFFKEAYKYSQLGNHGNSISVSLHFLSATALQIGYLEEAKNFGMQNMSLTEKSSVKFIRIDALTDMANYYTKTNNPRKAIALMMQALEMKDSLQTETNKNQLNILGNIYEAEKQQKEITRLQNEKEKQAASENRKSTLNKILIVSICLILILGYLGYSNFKKGQQLHKQEQAIQYQKINELEKDKQLLSIDAMLKGQEEERNRLAQDLHDGLGSLLSGTKMSFINFKEKQELSGESKVLFEKSLCMLDNTIIDLRKIAQNLMPQALVKFGLQEAVKDFCDSIQLSSGIKIVYQQYGDQRKPDNTAEVFTYRIIQELVNNAVKHAAANSIIVQLILTAEKILIAVEDNGKGFNKEQLLNLKGAGLANIQYRVQYFNGTFDIITSPENGTSVNIELNV